MVKSTVFILSTVLFSVSILNSFGKGVYALNFDNRFFKAADKFDKLVRFRFVLGCVVNNAAWRRVFTLHKPSVSAADYIFCNRGGNKRPVIGHKREGAIKRKLVKIISRRVVVRKPKGMPRTEVGGGHNADFLFRIKVGWNYAILIWRIKPANKAKGFGIKLLDINKGRILRGSCAKTDIKISGFNGGYAIS